MHIGLVVNRLIGRNGEEQGTAELAEALSRRGEQVTVLSAGQANPPADGAYEVVPLGIGRVSGRAAWQAFEEAVEAEAGRRRVDLVHSMGPTVRCDVYQPRGGTAAETYIRYAAMPRPLWGRWRVWLRVRLSSSIRVKLATEREFFARRPAPVMVAMSQYVARQLRDHYGLPPAAIRPVFGAVRPRPADAAQAAGWRVSVRRQLEFGGSTTLLLFVAQQFSQKGLAYLIEALARAQGMAKQSSAFALAVIGRDEPGPYQRQARRLGVIDRLRFLGSLDINHVYQYYAAADVLVLPTVFDACSRTVLESLAAGTPAITTAQNGAGELVASRGAGAVISTAWAIDELADRLVEAADPQVRARWAAATAGLADYVSVERMAGEMIELYRQVLSGRKLS